MQQTATEVKEIKQILHNPNNIRYRKINILGSTTQAFTNNSPQKVRTKQLVLELPQFSPQQPQQPISIKVIEEDYYRRFKAQSGIKSLLKAYDQTRKKNSSQCMTKLGLDVMKIKSFSARKAQTKRGNSFPGPIHSKKSLRKLQLKHIVNSKDILIPIKARSVKQDMKLADNNNEVEFRHLIEMTTSLTNFAEKPKQQQMLFTSRKPDPKKILKRQMKAQDYLYKRLQGTEKIVKQQQNQIYDKRIKSYLDFLWKNQFAHNIYINLDLKNDDINARPKKLKAYIASGNNGAMVKGLIKRRYWWTISEQRTADCQFVWTQIKVNQIFERQKKTMVKKVVMRQDIDWQQDEQLTKKNKNANNKLRLTKLIYPLSEQYNKKIMNNEDTRLYKRYWNLYQKQKDRDFTYRMQHIPKELQILTPQNRGTIHNHLQNNFYLGNKKALFYNLKQYYGLLGQNVFHKLPLTFHIRKGLKDPEYLRFVEYHKRRAKQIVKELREEEEQGTSNKRKTRNIWIVKPGENSNQGKGITVIDEIYELNAIIKQGRSTNNADQEGEATFIVQMYIDRPLLYNNRKFDIRHFMLITNFFGITRAYWYEDGYIRTSSYQFDIDNFDPQIHLTNDSIQKRYADYGKYEPYNKLSYQQIQRYLQCASSKKQKCNFKEQILPQMKEMACDAAKSVYTKISPGNLMNNFEILGLDFMIDKNLQPWLIQINTNPCLDCSSPILNRIIPYLLQQSFKLTLDLAFPPPTHYPNTCKHFAPLVSLDNFKYQLIFDSQQQGGSLQKLYKRIRSNLIEQIGEIEQDQQFKDEGKQCKLDDYT